MPAFGLHFTYLLMYNVASIILLSLAWLAYVFTLFHDYWYYGIYDITTLLAIIKSGVCPKHHNLILDASRAKMLRKNNQKHGHDQKTSDF